ISPDRGSKIYYFLPPMGSGGRPLMASIRVFGEHRLDRTAPWAVEFLQQLLGRRHPAFDIVLNRLEVPGLVALIPIEALAPRQALARQFQTVARDLVRAAPGNARLEAGARHLIAQLLTLLGGPALDHVPRGFERIVVVEQADPQRRQRGEA